MTMLDIFAFLFTSNAKDVKKDMAEAEKATKDLQQAVNSTDKPIGQIGESLLKAGAAGIAAFASWEGLKSGIKNAQDYNLEIYRTSQLTGENAHELSVWDDVFTQATGKRGEFLSFFTQYSQHLQAMGLDTRNAMPNIRAFVKELSGLSDKEARIRFASIAQANQIPLDFALALRDAHFEKNLETFERINHVTEQGAKAAKEFDSAWQEASANISAAFSDLWGIVSPIFTGILKFFNTPIPVPDWMQKFIPDFFLTKLPSKEETAANAPPSPNAPLGIRNNNPGNLRSWGGVPSTGGFAQFPSLQSGLDAEQKQLELYGKRGVNTLAAIASKWAPPSENNTPAYIAGLVKSTGFSPFEKLDLSDAETRQKIANAINKQESGAAYGNLLSTAKNSINVADNSNLQISGARGVGGGTSLNVGDITIHTQATDANGIASAIDDKLNYHFRNTVSNYDDMEAR